MSFAVEYDRLLRLVLGNAAPEEQKAALRNCARLIQTDGIVIVPTLDGLLVNNEAPKPPDLPTLLHTRLLAHWVKRMDVAPGTMPAELLAIGRALMQVPIESDPGRVIRNALPDGEGRGIVITVAGSANWLAGRRSGQVMDSGYMGPLQQAPAGRDAYLPFATPNAIPSPLRTLFETCDTASVQDSPRAVDALIAYGEAALNSGRTADLLDLLIGAITREQTLPSIDGRRSYGAVRRRFRLPPVLLKLARLIPAGAGRRTDIITVLAAAEELGANAVIEQLVLSEQRSHRQAYLAALREMPVGEKAVLHMMTDDRWYVVRNAAYLVGELHVHAAEPALLRLSSHPDERVRAAVYTALAKLGTPRAIAMLQQ
jgi:hypothetical protein